MTLSVKQLNFTSRIRVWCSQINKSAISRQFFDIDYIHFIPMKYAMIILYNYNIYILSLFLR